MQLEEQPKLAEMIEELCGIYGRAYSDSLVRGYYRVLKPYTIAAIQQAAVRLMGDTERKQVMPLPSEIKSLASRFERSHGTNLDDERWRRRYDVWQTGRFTDEALAVAFAATDEALGLDQIGGEEYTCIRCQHPGCVSLIVWPPQQTGEGRLFCPAHRPSDHGHEPVTLAEKQRILSRATPAAKAFLRSIPEIARHMEGIPISDEEDAAAAEASMPMRAKAFEETADGPGVNPSVFLNRLPLHLDLHPEYAERRQIMAAAGWRYDVEAGEWKKRWRRLTDAQVDSFGDKGLLEAFVGRR